MYYDARFGNEDAAIAAALMLVEKANASRRVADAIEQRRLDHGFRFLDLAGGFKAFFAGLLEGAAPSLSSR